MPQQRFFWKRARKRFLGKATVWLCPLSSLGTAHCTSRFLTERGHYRARKADAKSAAVAVRRSLAYAPCGDAGGKEISIALRRRGRQGKNGKLRHLLPQSRCRCSIGQQDSSLKKAPIMRRWLNNPSGLPFASHRLGGARKTPPRSGNFPTMGNFQARKWSTPHRGVAKKAFARPLHRGG